MGLEVGVLDEFETYISTLSLTNLNKYSLSNNN